MYLLYLYLDTNASINSGKCCHGRGHSVKIGGKALVKRNHLPQLFFRIVKVKVWDSQIGPTLSDFRNKNFF